MYTFGCSSLGAPNTIAFTYKKIIIFPNCKLLKRGSCHEAKVESQSMKCSLVSLLSIHKKQMLGTNFLGPLV